MKIHMQIKKYTHNTYIYICINGHIYMCMDSIACFQFLRQREIEREREKERSGSVQEVVGLQRGLLFQTMQRAFDGSSEQLFSMYDEAQQDGIISAKQKGLRVQHTLNPDSGSQVQYPDVQRSSSRSLEVNCTRTSAPGRSPHGWGWLGAWCQGSLPRGCEPRKLNGNPATHQRRR